MLWHQFTRTFHTTRLLASKVEKGALAALRKKTGYTFANCKKALELHHNDISLAEKWLNEQAQSFGWSKATKLADRTTAQGLVGVLIRGNIGTMVEVNCETDFVARNDNFKNFVDQASRLCARYTEMTTFDGDLWKMGFEAEALKNLQTEDGKTLGDHLALLIGTVGENAAIKRAICFKTNNELKLAGYSHPTTSDADAGNTENLTQVGKYGTIVAFRNAAMNNDELNKNLCQHILGLNPRKIGDIENDKPTKDKDDEECLIYQEYLLDAEKTVGEVLKENMVTIVDYQRYACGEISKNEDLEQAKLSN